MISVYLGLGLFFGLIIYTWYRAYPHPYRDIPYNEHSARRFLGDIPDLIQFAKDGNDPEDFVSHQCRKLNSPIIQLFFVPFARPYIFCEDVVEVENIVCHRTRELDRAPMTINTFFPFFPASSILKQTTPEWRAQRRLWKDTASGDFIRRIAGPHMYKFTLELVELLRLKASIGGGRPFPVRADFDLVALDIIWASFFGSELHGIQNEITGTRHYKDPIQQPSQVDECANIPPVQKGDVYEALEYLNATVEVNFTSPLPVLNHWLLRQAPKYRRCWALKENVINGFIGNARTRFAVSGDTGSPKTCAIDMVLERELSAIARPNALAYVIPPTDKEIHDELFMLLVAGHETTASTLVWCVKLLTNNPDAQTTLRDALLNAFEPLPSAHQPGLDDILNMDVPYLDATLEECIRLANIVPRIARVATEDTEILGCHIPKGAQIMCTTNVSSLTLWTHDNRGEGDERGDEEKIRPHAASQSLHRFCPERWLNDAGKFNPQALRRLAFSGGPRVCFGRKFALQELRVILVILLLNFRFESVPEHLNSMRSDPKVLRKPRQAYVRLTYIGEQSCSGVGKGANEMTMHKLAQLHLGVCPAQES